MTARKVGDRCSAQSGSIRTSDDRCRGRIIQKTSTKYRPQPGDAYRTVDVLVCDRAGHAWGLAPAAVAS